MKSAILCSKAQCSVYALMLWCKKLFVFFKSCMNVRSLRDKTCRENCLATLAAACYFGLLCVLATVEDRWVEKVSKSKAEPDDCFWIFNKNKEKTELEKNSGRMNPTASSSLDSNLFFPFQSWSLSKACLEPWYIAKVQRLCVLPVTTTLRYLQSKETYWKSSRGWRRSWPSRPNMVIMANTWWPRMIRHER